MADLMPRHSIRVAPSAAQPVVCDGCGRVGQLADGKLPDGWRIVDLPSCEWRFGPYYECPRCAREMDARLRAGSVAS